MIALLLDISHDKERKMESLKMIKCHNKVYIPCGSTTLTIFYFPHKVYGGRFDNMSKIISGTIYKNEK